MSRYVDEPPPADVSFVVLNWQAATQTARCVQSLLDLRGEAVPEIVVVDNGSTPASRAELADRIPTCRVVASTENLGFTGGMNLGAGQTTAPLIALLNNDLVLPPDWLEVALDVLLDDERIGILGGKSYAWDDDRNPCYGRGNDATSVHVVDPHLGSATLSTDDIPRSDVASVDGSALLVRRAAWDRIGGFDERYFAYGEEVDLCARCLAAGWRVVYDPALASWHRRNSSSDRIPVKRAFLARRNQARNVAKHFPEAAWRRAVLRLVREFAWYAVWGRQGGLRSGRSATKLSRFERAGLMGASAWIATHLHELERSRREAIDRGLHCRSYTHDLTALYDAGAM